MMLHKQILTIDVKTAAKKLFLLRHSFLKIVERDMFKHDGDYLNQSNSNILNMGVRSIRKGGG